jgi:predicted ABC-type ATPase
MNDPLATMFVFAGNNGSGKSTIRNLIIDKLGVSVNIDPDSLARGIDIENPESRKVSAGKEAIKLARECIHQRRDFTVETTLAGGNVIRQMREAKANGFEIIMFYVGLGDVRLNIERVAARVRNGGHHIETADILRRQQTSINNLLNHLVLINHLIIIDNSGAGGEIVMEADWMQIKQYSPELPEWVEMIERALVERNNLED